MPHSPLASRSEVAQEDTWSLESFFATDQDVRNAIANCYTLTQDFTNYKGTLIASPEILFEGLSSFYTINCEVGKVYVYTHLKKDQDSTNSESQDLASQSEKLLVAVDSATSFVKTELSELTPKKLDTFIYQKPELIVFKRRISEILRQKEHILDASTESLLSQFEEIANGPRNIYGMFNNADMTFPTITNTKGEAIQITHGNYIDLLHEPDRTVRQAAFSGVYTSYDAFKNTSASIYASNVAQASLFAKLRKFPSVIEQALSHNNIPVAVYDNLVDTVREHLPLMHDYLALRQETMGLEELHMYDLFVPLVSEIDKKITFDEACEIILKAMEPLGADYVAILKEAFDNRWIDRYENKGKRSGAYSWGSYGAPHPYVLMNYTENIDNLFTLAHEMGHAVHSYLSHRTQPQPVSSYCIFVAEVASTVNESLLMQYLLKTTTDPLYRKYLINYFMEQFRSTVYRQTMFAEFERDMFKAVQEGKTLTTDFLCSSYYTLVKQYQGDKMCVDPAIAVEWSRIPHFFNTPFYVYQYATGFSAAVALSSRILKEGEVAVADYKTFLSGGSSKDPIDLLKDAGVDMSTKKPIEDALLVFKNLIQEFKEL